MESILAHTPDIPMQDEDDKDQYLAFKLAGEEYGVDIMRVQEIRGWDGVTPVPNMPDYILGVMNLRGTVVPVFDLRKRFCMQSGVYDQTTVTIVMKVADAAGVERTMGVVVDAVTEVYNIGEKDLMPAPEFGGAVNAESIEGLATVDDRMIILLNIDQLMNIEAMHEPGDTGPANESGPA